jgi:aminomethyltransferase
MISDRALAQYEYVHSEHGAGVTLHPNRSLLRVTGPDRLTFLQGMLTNDMLSVAPGHGCRAEFLNSTGHIMADVEVHVFADAVLLETDPRCAVRLAETLDRYLIMDDAAVEDAGSEWRKLTVVGRGSADLLAGVGFAPFSGHFPVRSHALLPGAGRGAMGDGGAFAAAVPRARVPSIDLWIPAGHLRTAWRLLTRAGAAALTPKLREILRVEAGLAAWGTELDESVLLPEADIAEAVSYTKGCYIGQEIVARIHARGHANRLLRGLRIDRNGSVPPAGASLRTDDTGEAAGREIGRITSAVYSPLMGQPLALGYVRREYAVEGTEVFLEANGLKRVSGVVLERPFSNPI